jgi:hypothetical protein
MNLGDIILALIAALVIVTLFFTFGVLVWVAVVGDRQDAHWPSGLDEDATLDVQNHVGDARSR